MDKNGLHIKGGGIDISNNAGTKVFYADTNGNLVLSASITAASGKIGGFTIDSTSLRGNLENATGGTIALVGNASGSEVALAIGADSSNRKFTVTANGILTATGANITGIINATDGTFSGTISTTKSCTVGTTLTIGSLQDDDVYGNRQLNFGKFFKINFANQAFSISNANTVTYPTSITMKTSDAGHTLQLKTEGMIEMIGNRGMSYAIGSRKYISVDSSNGLELYNPTAIGTLTVEGTLSCTRGTITTFTASSITCNNQLNASYGWLGLQYATSGGQWLGFYGSKSTSNRKGWIGHNGTSDFYIQCESGSVINLIGKSGISIQYLKELSGSYRTIWRPSLNGGAYLGTTSYRWNTGFFTNSITQSDLKEKRVLEDFDMKAIRFVMGLKPIAYNRIGDGDTGKRVHLGFGAQTVNQLIKDLNIGDLALAQASIVNEDGTESPYHGEDIDDSKLSWGLNYEELIAPMVATIQSQQKEMDDLKKQVQELQKLVFSLLNKSK